MFESLQENLAGAFKTLRGKSKLTESNMRDGLALVQKALLEADVSYPVVKDFIAKVSEEALGERVLSVARSQPAGRGHRASRARRADGAGRSLAAPEARRDRADDVRPAGLRQNDHLR